MPIDGFGFGDGWFNGFATGCVASGYAVAGLSAVSFEVLGLAAASLAIVRFMQHLLHHSDAAET